MAENFRVARAVNYNCIIRFTIQIATEEATVDVQRPHSEGSKLEFLAVNFHNLIGTGRFGLLRRGIHSFNHSFQSFNFCFHAAFQGKHHEDTGKNRQQIKNSSGRGARIPSLSVQSRRFFLVKLSRNIVTTISRPQNTNSKTSSTTHSPQRLPSNSPSLPLQALHYSPRSACPQ